MNATTMTTLSAPIRPTTCVDAYVQQHIRLAALRSRAVELAIAGGVFFWLGLQVALHV